MRRNDFLARPEHFHGGVTGGVESHPGFHTADSVETTYAYAQQKAVPEDLDEITTLGTESAHSDSSGAGAHREFGKT